MGEKEAIARAIYEWRNGHGCKPWALLTKAHKEPYLGDAEAALRIITEANFPGRAALKEASNG